MESPFHAQDSPHFHTVPNASAKTGSSASISANLWISGPGQGQRHDGEGGNQLQATGPGRRADMDRSHAHAEAQVLGIARTAFDAPALAIERLQAGS